MKDDMQISNIQKSFDKIDLNKKYPGYINKKIGRVFISLMVLVIVLEFIIGGGQWHQVSYKCPADNELGCKNPFYQCEPGELIDCNPEVPSYLCKNDFCHQKTIPAGTTYGRTDWLSKNGILIMILILPMIIITNHLAYWARTGNWKYKKEK